jgi:hypothetical protein
MGAISDFLEKRERSKKLRLYRDSVGRRLNLQEEFLARNFVEAEFVYDLVGELLDPGNEVQSEVAADSMDSSYISIGLDARRKNALEELEANGLIIRDGPQINIEPEFIQPAKAMVSFLSSSASKSSGAQGQ